MAITVYPYKLTQRELEARLAPGLTVLPGQLLRFEGVSPVYGQIQEVCALPPASAGMPEGYGVCIRLLHGCPTLEPQQVTLLNAAQMALEVQQLQAPFRQPMQLGKAFTAELFNLGALTLVEGDDFVLKYEALQLFLEGVRPYCQVLIIDPLGLFTEEDELDYRQAGRDVRLSVQAVGSRRFLGAFGELFSISLRDEALRVVAEHLPSLQDFTGFSHLLNIETAVNVPLRNLIAQNYHAVAQAHVFADAPEQILSLDTLAAGRELAVVDLSELKAPWKSLFYEQLCLELFQAAPNLPKPILPVLIYPENYLGDLPAWVQRADEAEMSLLVLASPYSSDMLREMANNRVRVESRQQVEMQGVLTLGLPISFALGAHEDAEPPLQVNLPVSAPEEMWLIPKEPPALPSEAPATPVTEKALEAAEQLVGDLAEPAVEMPPLRRKPPEQAWWFEVSQPVLEDEEEENGEGEPAFEPMDDVAEPALGQNLGEAELAVEPPHIVDLSAPLPEPTISFLSAEQLSELLSSSPVAPENPLPEAASAYPAYPPDYPKDSLDYPDAEEGALQLQKGLVTGGEVDLLPPALEEIQNGLEPAETHAEPEAPGQEPVNEAVPELTADNEAGRMTSGPMELMEAADETFEATPPPFPTPEEFARDEFSFELHLDQSEQAVSGEEGYYSSYLGEGESLPDTVSRSLSEFEDMDLSAVEEPLFDFEPELYTDADAGLEAATSYSSEETYSAEAPVMPQEGLAKAHSDAEIREALDSIFPQEFMERTPDGESALQAVEPLPESPPAPVAPPPEDIPVYQKPVEPMSGNEAGFQAGDRVRHPAYGLGVVQRVIPMEESVVLNIVFEAVGKRLLDPALSELVREPVA